MTATTATPTPEHCGNCANARSDTQHTTCTASRDVGMLNLRPPVRCVCTWVANFTKHPNCPGWVAAWTSDAKRCAAAAVDALTVAYHTGKV